MICKVEKRKSKQKTNNKYLQKVAAQEFLIYHIIEDWDLLVNNYLAICFFKGVRKYLKLIPVLICWFFKLVFLSFSNLIFTVCVAFKIQVRNRQKIKFIQHDSTWFFKLDLSNFSYLSIEIISRDFFKLGWFLGNMFTQNWSDFSVNILVNIMVRLFFLNLRDLWF